MPRAPLSPLALSGYLLALYAADDDHGATALDMMTTCDANSWCSMLRQGATATMEAWTREEKPNLSWSHPWASAPATAISRGFMGVRALSPAYKHFLVKPQPGNVTRASMSLPTQSGSIVVSFEQSDTKFALALYAPPNTLARVCLPKLGLPSSTLTVDGKTMAAHQEGDYLCVDDIGCSAGANTERHITRE